MKKLIAGLLVVGLGALASGASADDDLSQWSLENCVDAAGKATKKITSGTKCELKNKKKNQCLIRVAKAGQTDWDFAACDQHPKSMLFQKEGGGTVGCNDTVALELGLGGENHTRWYRKCVNPQTLGINICQDEGASPAQKHFDWQPKCSGTLEEGKTFALFNKSQKDSVVYAKRPSVMVDTCWAGNMKHGLCASARDE